MTKLNILQELQQIEEEAWNEKNFDKATVLYKTVDEVISRMENVLKDFRADYFQEYNDVKQVYYVAQEKLTGGTHNEYTSTL